MNSSQFWCIFEQLANVFDNTLLMIFPTVMLGRKNKNSMNLFVFFATFLFLMLLVNAYVFLGVFQNIIAIFLLFLYALIALNGTVLKKISISAIAVFSIGITSVPIIFATSLLSQVETDVVFTAGNERFFIIVTSKIVSTLVMFLIYYFAKRKGTLNPSQWLITGVLFTLTDLANSFVLSYTSIYSISADAQYAFLGVSCCMFLIAVVGFVIFTRVSHENQIKHEYEILLNEKKYQHRNLETIRMNYEELRHLKHDFKNYLLIIKSYIINSDYENAIEECEKVTGKFDKIETLVDCEPLIISLILNEKIQKAKTHSIAIKCKAEKRICVEDDTNFIIVLSNLLDNAIEHCRTLSVDKRKIDIQIQYKMGYLVLKITNPISVDKIPSVLEFKTSKLDKKNHGIGHESTQKIVDRDGGEIKYSVENNHFIAQVLFLRNDKNKTQHSNS